MSQVYRVLEDGRTTALSRVRCADEDRELQRILEQNPDLLPGEQIDPEQPRRWLLVKREMPVPDPATAENRWSIDFLFADQDAIPTFVECKRFSDTRSRREVVGQVLEYVANGHYYWTKEDLRDFAEQTAAAQKQALDEVIRQLAPDFTSTDGFFERMEQNLREAQVRIVFFLEESPMELRSLVDFLNKQMERSEVLLVEARQYEEGSLRVVAPTLFGYTEEARQVKRVVTVSKPGGQRTWDRAAFLEKARQVLLPHHADLVARILETCEQHGYQILWGVGANPSLKVCKPAWCSKTLLALYANGDLWLPFAGLKDAACQEARDQLKAMADQMKLHLPDDWASRWITIKLTDWVQEVDTFIAWLKQPTPAGGTSRPADLSTIHPSGLH